ncbi:MAG TPA: flippase [Candidatus Magasanikbacteria bacterium]|nr:flippase [Candidatus Magasanikbacteria bacterium]
MASSVAKNTTFMTAASIAQRVVSFVYFIIIARIIGVENTGDYFFALSFSTIFLVVADFGLNNVLVRELARDQEKGNNYLNSLLSLKFILGIFSYVLIILFANILGYAENTKQLIYVAGITVIFDSLQNLFYASLRAAEKLKYEALGIFMSQVLTMIIGTTALILQWPLYFLILAYTIPSFLSVFYAGYFTAKNVNWRFRPVWQKEILKPFFLMALPFFAAAIIGKLYSFSDSLLMSKILDKTQLGYWSVPYKIVFAFQFIPTALTASLYPVISALHTGENKERIAELLLKGWRYLLLIVMPLMFGIYAIADNFIVSFYTSAYAPSAAVLKVLIFSLIFSYLNYTMAALLNAVNKQTEQTLLLFFALILSVCLNLWLLPKFAVMGAAVSALLSNGILFAFTLWRVRKVILLPIKEIILLVDKCFWPSVIMAAVVIYLQNYWHFILCIVAGIFVYLAAVFVFGGLTRDDLNVKKLI